MAERRMVKTIRRASAVAVIAVLVACSGGDDGAPIPAVATRAVICAVNEPLAFFAERIGGDSVEVRRLVPPDIDPAFWVPGTDDVAAFQEADLVIDNGADYAKWMSLVSLPASKIVDTTAAMADSYIAVDAAPTHTHGPEGAHDHTGTAFTTWIDFAQAAVQARAIRDALVALRPADAAVFEANAAALDSELLALDEAMESVADDLGGAAIVASHPVYQYWARRYGLDVRAVTWEPETVPDARALAELDRLLAERFARLMIWESEPDARSVELLAERGIASVVFSPGANRSGPDDFLTLMRANLQRLGAAAAP